MPHTAQKMISLTRHAERADGQATMGAADPELFRHSMQNPMEWSVRGFEEEMTAVMATPGVVALAMVLASGPDATTD